MMTRIMRIQPHFNSTPGGMMSMVSALWKKSSLQEFYLPTSHLEKMQSFLVKCPLSLTSLIKSRSETPSIMPCPIMAEKSRTQYRLSTISRLADCTFHHYPIRPMVVRMARASLLWVDKGLLHCLGWKLPWGRRRGVYTEVIFHFINLQYPFPRLF